MTGPQSYPEDYNPDPNTQPNGDVEAQSTGQSFGILVGRDEQQFDIHEHLLKILKIHPQFYHMLINSNFEEATNRIVKLPEHGTDAFDTFRKTSCTPGRSPSGQKMREMPSVSGRTISPESPPPGTWENTSSSTL